MKIVLAEKVSPATLAVFAGQCLKKWCWDVRIHLQGHHPTEIVTQGSQRGFHGGDWLAGSLNNRSYLPGGPNVELDLPGQICWE